MRELAFTLNVPTEATHGANRPGAGEANAAKGAGKGSFAADLGQAIGEVDKLQLAADQQVDKQAHGAGNIHEVSIALEKADVALRLATKIRNKVVDAYNEIMRMGV